MQNNSLYDFRNSLHKKISKTCLLNQKTKNSSAKKYVHADKPLYNNNDNIKPYII